MNISKKILITMISLTIVVAVAVLVSNIVQFSGYVDGELGAALNSASSTVFKEIDMFKSQAAVASHYLAEDAAIIEALQNGNREELQNRAAQMFADTGAGFCTIVDASGLAITRAHNQEMYGDDVSSMPSVTSALSGKALATIEEGASVCLSACSASPIYDGQGGIIGAAVVGFPLDTTEFVDSIKGLFGYEVTVFLGDERVATTVLKEDGTRAVGTKSAANVSEVVLAGKTYTGEAKVLEHDAFVIYSPILGNDGKALGMLFIGGYLDDKTETIFSFLKLGLIITLILLAVSVAVILFIAGHIVSPIKDMVKAAHALAAGDTNVSVRSDTKDETRELASAFNEMIENTRKQVEIIEAIADGDLSVTVNTRSDKDVMNHALTAMLELNNETFAQIIGSSHQVTSGAQQMASSSQMLAQGVTEQSATMQELSAVISEVDANTKDSSVMAHKAASLSKTIAENAKQGSKQMERMVQSVKEINEASFSISKIMKVIDDIAFQTNILALNASVEAARAGQHGKGFAVVADEVRSLAAKSAQAAKETGSLIENSIAKAELGANIADETADSLNGIISGIGENNRMVEEIAKYAEQQSDAIAQINKSISHVADVIRQNSSSAEESAVVSEDMSAQAELLTMMVSRFNLKNTSGSQIRTLPSNATGKSPTKALPAARKANIA